MTAPRAYSPGGAEARAWLRSTGRVIELYTDARGAALVDPGWTTVGGMATARRSPPRRSFPRGSCSLRGRRRQHQPRGATRAVRPASGPSAPPVHATARFATPRRSFPRGRSSLREAPHLLLRRSRAPSCTIRASGPSAPQDRSRRTLPHGDAPSLGEGARRGRVTSPALFSAELYDPCRGPSRPRLPSRCRARCHTATLLPSGKVLVAGGYSPRGIRGTIRPATGTFMRQDRL